MGEEEEHQLNYQDQRCPGWKMQKFLTRRPADHPTDEQLQKLKPGEYIEKNDCEYTQTETEGIIILQYAKHHYPLCESSSNANLSIHESGTVAPVADVRDPSS